MPPRSATRPISPSSASISRTRWPLPRPPIAGLQDIAPIVSKRCVTSATSAPIRAAAAAASHPACPPPTTTTSKRSCMVALQRQLVADHRAAVHLSRNVLSVVFHVKHKDKEVPPGVGKLTWPFRSASPITPPLLRRLLTDAEIAKDHVQDILHIDTSQQLAKRPRRQPEMLGHDFFAAIQSLALGFAQYTRGFPQMGTLPLPRHQRRFPGEVTFGIAAYRVIQFFGPFPALAG